MNEPAITVLMPLYNGAAHVRAAVDSVLGQTFGDFELLIIDDGSTDEGPKIVRALDDRRIRLVVQPENRGIVPTLNQGLALATGRYVARMDADDLMVAARLERQFSFMESHPGVGVCGTFIRQFSAAEGAGWVRYTRDDELKAALLFENPFCHPSVMLRRQVLTAAGGAYPSDSPHAEEYALWARLAPVTQFANLPEVLLEYRVHARQISRLHSRLQCESIDRIMRQQLGRLGVADVTGAELRLHQTLGTGFYPLPGYKTALRTWTRRLVAANERSRFLPQAELEQQLVARTRGATDRMQRELARMPFLRRRRWQAGTWWHHHFAES